MQAHCSSGRGPDDGVLAAGGAAPVVLLSQRLGDVTDEERRLELIGAEVNSAALGTQDDIRANGREADVIILGAVEPFDRAALDSLPRLRAIVRRGVGYDNVDVEAATAAGILVANVPDASVEEVSDHALSLLLALERRLFGLHALVERGSWHREPAAIHRLRLTSRRFSDLTLGIVGFGRIGAALARKARSVYGHVKVFDVVLPEPDRLGGLEFAALDEVLSVSDHISLHLPMSEQNRYLIDAAAFARMRRGAVVVNTARGGLVDEAALVAALRSGTLAAAALDATEQEPVEEECALLAPDLADRLILTAHSAAWSEAAAAALTVRSVDAVADLLSGRLPRSLVNPDVVHSPMSRSPDIGLARGQPADRQQHDAHPTPHRSGENQ